MLKSLFHIQPASSEDHSQDLLSIRVGERHCSFAVTDKTGATLYNLAYYSTDSSEINPVSALFAKHPELDRPFYKVLASYDFPQSTIVPLPLYRKEESGSLLKGLFGLNGNSFIVSEPISEWAVYNVYAIPRDMHDWMNKKFSAGNYWHQYTVALRSLQSPDVSGQLLVDLRAEDFTIIATKGTKLLLTQTFSYSTPDDVLYYLLRTCQEHELSQQETRLLLSGLIDKQSALYKELYQYFIRIEFRDSAWGQQSQDYPSHFFTSLNDLARCAS